MHAKLLQLHPNLCDLWTVAHQAPPSMGFSRQESWVAWSGLPCPPPGYLPDPGVEPWSLMSPALASRFFTTSITWDAHPLLYLHFKTKYLEFTYVVIPTMRMILGTSLVVHWLRIHLAVQGGMGQIPGRGIKIPHATAAKRVHCS